MKLTKAKVVSLINKRAKMIEQHKKPKDIPAWVYHFHNYFKKDAQDLRTIANYIKRNRLQNAAEKAQNLDTIISEHLPASFFRYMQKTGYW